ncbi:MAG TPA: hypothetical protein VIF11_15795 [Methylomirabilota bacterium]|jgi:hypothetical protein
MKRIFQAKDLPLLRAPIGNCGINVGTQRYFAIRTPSTRLVTTISFIYWQQVTGQATAFGPNPGLSVNYSQNGQLTANGVILYAGMQAETGWVVPVTELVGVLNGSQYQTIPLPWASGILFGVGGFSIDVAGGQEWVGGIFGAGGCPAGYAGGSGVNLSMRVKWENAQGAQICDDEWKELLPLMTIQAPDPVIYT